MHLRFFHINFEVMKGGEDVKVGVMSDLHIDSNAKKLAPGQTYDHLLAELLYNQEIDLLLLAGDVSSDYHDTFAFLDRMRNHNVSKIQIVPGNHDFWSIRNREEDTERIYQLFKARDENPVGNPFLIGKDWAVVGNPGWYDYGFASDGYTIEELSRKKLKVGGWNDRQYVHWQKDDLTVAAAMQAELENDLKEVSSRKIIMMTHVVTHPQFVIPLPHPVYDYYNAFLGNKSYMELYDRYPIVHSIMGHVHFRKMLYEKKTTFYCACLGNARHWYTDDPYIEMAYTMEEFIVDI